MVKERQVEQMGVERSLEYWLEQIYSHAKQSGVPGWKQIAEAFAHITEADDRGLYGQICYLAAYCRLMEGRLEEAINYLTESIRCLPGTERESELARCYNLLGVIAHGQNNLILAMEQYDVALIYAERFELRMIHSMIASNMADAYYRMGDYGRAVKCYRDCISEYENSGDESAAGKYNIQLILAGYGYCLVMAGRTEEAVQAAERLWARMCGGNRAPVLAAFTFFALLCHKLGNQREADKCMELAIRDIRDNACTLMEFDNLLDLLDYLIIAQKYDRIKKVLDCAEPQVVSDKNEGLLLQLLLLRMEYCSESLREEEFMAYAGRFLNLKEKYEAEENAHALRMLKLRKQLRNIAEERLELEQQNEELLYKSRHDQITGLPNRGYLNWYLEKAFEEAEKGRKTLGVMFVDIDCFKEMNDRYGHQSGDRCIAAVAQAIKQAVPGEFAARYGGDEFVVVTKGRDEGEIRDYAERIGDMVRSMRMLNADSTADCFVTVTIGAVNGVPGERDKVWDFLRTADEALYDQKKEVKGGFRYCDREPAYAEAAGVRAAERKI